MDTIKVEPDSQSPKQPTVYVGDFEFVAPKHEQDPLAETLKKVSDTKSVLRNFTTVKQELKEEVTVEEHEVDSSNAALQNGNQGDFNSEGIYSSSQYNTHINSQPHFVRSVAALRETAFTHETSTQIRNSPNITHSTCETTERLFSINEFRNRSRMFPYKCEVCTKAFLFRSHLVKHMRTHTGEKPYTCNYCNKSFSHKVTLRNHFRVHTGEKPYSCKDCNKTFSQEMSLINHIQIHTGQKPYKCDICSKNFSLKLYLMSHIRSHMDNKLYECALCKKNFIHKSILISHLHIHMAKKLF